MYGHAETWEGKLAHRVVRWSMRQTKELHLHGLDTRVRSLERARLHAGRLGKHALEEKELDRGQRQESQQAGAVAWLAGLVSLGFIIGPMLA